MEPWRFVQISDPHLGGAGDEQRNNRVIASLMPNVMHCLRKDLAELEPDFVLATGDMINEPTRDSVFAARDFLDFLGHRYYPMGGNRDFLDKESRAWFMEAYHAHLPTGDTVYSFTHKNLHVCVLDPWWVWSDGSLCDHCEPGARQSSWAVPPHQLKWMIENLEEYADTPTVIAVHYPATPVPDRLRKPDMEDAGCLDNGDLLMDLLSEHAQVKAIFSGHAHMNYVVDSSGPTQVVTSALAEFPVEFREVLVYPDRMEINTRALSDTTFAAQSLMEGAEWTAGESCDRSIVVEF